ncbi:MAG: hypothetical protein QF903_16345 [Planctomycetota bacterium]|jgi:hypothetical protein|nr:hypothetical protein [Planctomycetota bacterium]MDP6761331.1 hypothetical protein [Planctomycetota bacterium]MDP6991042.1 hypothetical protein [Planctomycetota bacterium]
MNRSIALFVAMAVLAAHSLTIYTDPTATLAVPTDLAYVALRIGREWVHEGTLTWFAGQDAFESYPSLGWLAFSALLQRLHWLPLNPAVQLSGAGAAMATLVLASRLHPDRIASMIAPFLLAICGGVAAAAVSGTETAFMMCAVTAAFLAFERDRPVQLGVALTVCGLLRPEGWLLAGVMALLRAVSVARGAPARSLAAFAAPAGVFALVAAVRREHTGTWTSAYTEHLLDLRSGELQAGLGYLLDFTVSSVSPLLLVFVLWPLLRGRLSATGLHAGGLFVAWASLVVLGGGGGPVFGEALVPALPLALIAAQEGMILTLNSHRAWIRGVAWTGFLAVASLSALGSAGQGSQLPGPAARLHADLMRPSHPPRFGYEDRRGLAGLEEEIARTRALRGLGVFLRDHVETGTSVLTAWPGAVAYLSHLPVRDLLGRTDPRAPEGRQRPWHAWERIDVLAAIEEAPDYIVPFLTRPRRFPTRDALAEGWVRTLDLSAREEGRTEEVSGALAAYELVSVPAGISDRPGRRTPTFLLRRRELALSPTLELTVEEGEIVVRMRADGHEQLADLRVWAARRDGHLEFASPPGEFSGTRNSLARTNLLLAPTAERPIELFRAALPPSQDEEHGALVSLHAVLRNPEATGRHDWADASDRVSVRF